MRRTLLLLPLLGSTSAFATETATEADLVRRFLAAPVAASELEAFDASNRAARTGVSLLDTPALEARHEAARGPWGATTDAVGASVTVDLGLAPLAQSRAARLRGRAGEPGREALALASVCAFREDVLVLWSANRSASVHQEAQERLDTLLEALGELATAGEASGYDRDRTALAVVAHHARAAQALAEAESARALVSSLVGEPTSDVGLGELLPPPAADATLADHPALRALTLERDAARADRDAARRGQLPDLTLSGGPRWDAAPTGGSGTQGFEVGGSLSLPWMDGGRAEARQQAADHAATEARLTRARAELEAEVKSAHQRVQALSAQAPRISDPEAVWTAAMDRYTAGESSLDDLLQVADAVEAARLAEVEREHLQRRAHVDLGCAIGRFADPNLQSAFEEAIR